MFDKVGDAAYGSVLIPRADADPEANGSGLDVRNRLRDDPDAVFEGGQLNVFGSVFAHGEIMIPEKKRIESDP
jgi:hypothetical protein